MAALTGYYHKSGRRLPALHDYGDDDAKSKRY